MIIKPISPPWSSGLVFALITYTSSRVPFPKIPRVHSNSMPGKINARRHACPLW